MSKKVKGNLSGLSPSQLKSVEKLYNRKIDSDEIVTPQVARELYKVAEELRRRVGILISREGRIEEVFVGTREILYLPDLGRYREGKGRLRRLRLVFSDLSHHEGEAFIPHDIYTDLEKLRLDMVVSIRDERILRASYAYLKPLVTPDEAPVNTVIVPDLFNFELDFQSFIQEIESELSKQKTVRQGDGRAFLIGVYDKDDKYADESMTELRELVRSAGVSIAGALVQRRKPDPKTLLGKGKLEEVVLRCLRLEADILIFDTELKPSQWRVITNSTDIKVIDRSMLILDIFAQRATSSDGRLQVELAQLKYNLPRLVEKDAGLSRLTGGIGGRGPGETKLEIGRRRIRDRIAQLDKQIDKLGQARNLRRKKRKGIPVPLLAIIGYTNAGKSTLFNSLTKSSVLQEDKLFATLDPVQARFVLPPHVDDHTSYGEQVVLIDTVGFIRDLPEELKNAFRATLEELYEADLLLHVVDGSDSRCMDQIASVEEVLKEMELSDKRRVLVINKCDRNPQYVDVKDVDIPAVQVSATTREGFDTLRNALSEALQDKLRDVVG